jgi:hypothetical protein
VRDPTRPPGQRRPLGPTLARRGLGAAWLLFSGGLLAGAPWSEEPWRRAWAAWGASVGEAMGGAAARGACVGLGAVLLLVGAWDAVQLACGRSER